ncbi:MAG: NAD(P)/FAD-dependent oxidoreductase [Opitutales bacterium]
MVSLKQNDVVVIGGGPAGCTVSTLLAEQGWQVTLLEKERFPRYHVGESLMPFCYFTLDRLGLVDQLNRSGATRKYSVQFASTTGELSHPFYFFQHFDHEAATTWQVRRADFDHMLMNNAREKGVLVHEGVSAKKLLHDADGKVSGVLAKADDGTETEHTATLVIDATGRDAFAQTKLGWRQRDPQLNKVAIWTLYENAKRDAGLDAGATTIAYVPEKGWFWYIPLQDGKLSVGLVADRDYLYDGSTRDPKEIFNREIERSAFIKEHLEGARCTEDWWVTGEYSYRSKHCADDGLLLVGDAFGFLDPVFSSGVFLALKSGELAADAVDAALRDGDVSGERFANYGATLCRGIENMRKLVYAFYDENFSFGAVVRARSEVRGALTDCLIGDLFKEDYGGLFDAVADFAKLPAPLDYGKKPASQADSPKPVEALS